MLGGLRYNVNPLRVSAKHILHPVSKVGHLDDFKWNIYNWFLFEQLQNILGKYNAHMKILILQTLLLMMNKTLT